MNFTFNEVDLTEKYRARICDFQRTVELNYKEFCNRKLRMFAEKGGHVMVNDGRCVSRLEFIVT